MPTPAFAEVRRLEQTVHHALVCVGRGVRQERLDLFGRRRQTGQIEIHSTQPYVAIGIWGRLQSCGLQPSQHIPVQFTTRPIRIPHRRNGWGFDHAPHGVRLVCSSLLDPGPEQVDLLGRQRLARIGRRHDLIRIVAGDPIHQIAGVRLAGNDDLFRMILEIEPQLRLACRFVRTVALVTIRRKDRLDVPIELDPGGGSACGSVRSQTHK